MKEDIRQRINDLRQSLNQWNYEYYALSNPSVPDHVYDQAMQELIALETSNPEFKTADSPSIRVGGFVLDKFNKVKHQTPMLSLANAFNENDLNKFVSDLGEYKNQINGLVVEPKIDGLSISVIYENSTLVQALTRGDGQVGEDVTHNVKMIKDIPWYIGDEYKNTRIEVRGEVFMSNEDFTRLNDGLDEQNKRFANPRNAASGTLRSLDNKVVAERNLQSYMYYVVNANAIGLFSQEDTLAWLKQQNFHTNELIKTVKNINQVMSVIENVGDIRYDLPYQIDGIVIKVNNYNLYNDIGYTSKFPKWAIAYKFPAIIKSTKLKDIIIDVGRTGKITYTGLLEPIELQGSIIEYVALHNYDFIKDKDIRINDVITLYKAGDVIPYVDEVILKERKEDACIFAQPTNCPSCNSILVRNDEEVDWYCSQPNSCIQVQIAKIIYFVSRNAMNIDGLRDKIIKKFYEHKLINDVSDLYRLKDYEQIIYGLDLKIKEKSFNNIITNIEKSKKNSFERLITGLGIRFVGHTLAKKLAQNFGNLDLLMSADFEHLTQVDLCGEKAANSLLDFFANHDNKILINKLISYGINVTYISDIDLNAYAKKDEYKNKTFVITGTFDQPRNEIKNILENVYQIKVAGNISAKTDYLLCGQNAGSKKTKAESLGVKIISNEFWKK
ncbi:NAD-dependent DNA ligase LigA [Ureaplasma sp. ES3154-GEN]|uniref:NAD-dependent DNA ligase LigA n=1 Tax=Ureaplasma sp. ES3154-GEN TaxID=2984844 RepID=UPI0021E7EDB0|nr:NAD-dependent DNA ligase LigA [Ureaplasma sp. ES3154-GEN]MCV3743403.1 NAD-dependent DNA ligase LigA [Ureaplasma sp. ES3154-GEN]